MKDVRYDRRQTEGKRGRRTTEHLTKGKSWARCWAGWLGTSRAGLAGHVNATTTKISGSQRVGECP